MENIKITYIPTSKVEENEGLLKSVTDLSLYDTDLINPYILYNSNLELSIEDVKSSLFEYIHYIDPKNLYDECKKIITVQEDECVLILYGYDLELDFIKEYLCPLVHDIEEVFISINIVSDDENLKSNNNLYIDTECSTLDDDEWEEEKAEFEKAYKANCKNETNYELIITSQEDNIYSLLADLIEGVNTDLPSTKAKIISEEKLNKLDDLEMPIDNNYCCFTYEDINNYISITHVHEIATIEDEEGNKILFDKKGLDFILETLNKLKM